MGDDAYYDDRPGRMEAYLAEEEERAGRLIAEWNRRSGAEPKPRHRVKAGRREVE